MRLGPDLVRALRAIGRFPDDHLTSLADSRGSILVDVHRALYGLIDSPKLWYEHLISVFKKLGFSVSSHDRGVLYRHTTAGTCYAFIHVDDILLATPSIELEQELVARLNKEFGETSTQYPPRLFYLGMQIDIDPRSHAISITQPGFVASVLTAHPVSRVASSPYTADFLDEDSASPPCDATAFASRLMKLNFLVKRSRPDLGFCVSYLATRMHAPTKQDDVKLDRVYQYLARTAAAGITLSPDSFQIHAWIDASYAIHPDRKSHSGTVISLGNNGGPVFTRSAKQKLVSDSSTMAELIALHDGLHHVIWMRNLLRELGADPPPAVIYQDNMSTITLAQALLAALVTLRCATSTPRIWLTVV